MNGVESHVGPKWEMQGKGEEKHGQKQSFSVPSISKMPWPCQGLSWTPQTVTPASSALPMDSTWKWTQQAPPGPEPLLALPPPPQTAPNRHCPSHTAGTKLPLLLHLSPFFFSWKIPPNQQPQGILLMNFTRFWPLSLGADSFGTFDGKGSVFSCLTHSKTYLPSQQLSWIQQFLFKSRESLTRSNIR